MNFKSSYSTHMKSHDHLLSRVITDNKTFLRKLKRAIRYKKLDAFIIKLFDTYPFTIVQASFVTFFDNCCTTKFDGTFFTVCDAICRNISLLDEEAAISLISLLTQKYYEHQIYDTAEAFGHSLFSYMMTHLPDNLLEEAVLANFDEFVDDLYFEDIKYLGIYSSWRKELPKYFRNIMYLFSCRDFDDYINFTKLYPELAPAVYEYMLEIMINESESDIEIYVYDDFDLIDDFLRPISDLERYQGYYFENVRKYARKILDIPETYDIFLYTCDFMVENFEVFPELVNQAIDDNTDEIVRYIDNMHSDDDILELVDSDIFNDFFRSSRAYDRFMGKLPYLLKKHGILLYSVLLSILGPIYDLSSSKKFCRECLLESEEQKKSGIFIDSI